MKQKRLLKKKEFIIFFDDVTKGMQNTPGAPRNLREAFQKYNLEIPTLPPGYNDEYQKLLAVNFANPQQPGKPKYHCEVCTVCSLCLLCAEVDALAGAGSISSILALFNSAL